MKRKSTVSAQTLYRQERDRVRRERDDAFARIMAEARKEFEQEVENARIRGKGGRPRKDRSAEAQPATAPVEAHEDEHALDLELDDAAFSETLEHDTPPVGERTSKPAKKAAVAPDAKHVAKPATKPDTKQAAKHEAKPETKQAAKRESAPASKSRSTSRPPAKKEPAARGKAKPKPAATKTRARRATTAARGKESSASRKGSTSSGRSRRR